MTKNSHNPLLISRNRCKPWIAKSVLYFVSEFLSLAETLSVRPFAAKVHIIYFWCHTRLNFQPHSTSASANMSGWCFVCKCMFAFSIGIMGIIHPILKTVTQSLVQISKSNIRLLKLYTNKMRLISRNTRNLLLPLTLAGVWGTLQLGEWSHFYVAA